MRQAIVIGNWKMNGTLESTRELLQRICSRVGREPCPCDIGVCVPYTLIPKAREVLAQSRVLLGSQNVADHPSGAFTGEISAQMLKEFECKLTIVGHSERRQLYGESDQLVAARFKRAVDEDLTPILCVGESLEQRESNETFSTVSMQLGAVIKLCGADFLKNAIIAYEPVWAIGTGKTATCDQAQEVHEFLRAQVAAYNSTLAENLPIVYGGSVKPDNAEQLFAMPDIDGGLIGGASLDAESFLTICYSV